jgi:hypothetical protein
MTALTQPPPTLPGFEPVPHANVTELPPQPRASRRMGKAAEEQPADDVTTSLVDAVNKVYRVVTARIAYHEAEARRLREALKPFAGLPPAPEAAVGAEDALTELLAIAKRLPTAPGD